LALFFRLLVTLFGFWIASIVAAAILVLGAGAPDLPRPEAWPLISVFIFTTSAFVAAFAFVPAAVAIMLTETFSLRSMLVHAIAGGVIGLFCGYTLGFVDRGPAVQMNAPFGTNFELLAAAGIGAGLVYWLVAGRRAGMWRNSST
jgi:hypothetical protein